MATTSRASQPTHRRKPDGAPTVWAAFAGIVLFLNGCFAILFGLGALFNDKVVTVGGQGVTIFDFTAWGWISLLIGAVMVLTGIGLMMGKTAARWLGIVFAGISALAQFGNVSAFPLWSILIISLDIVVIQQLVTHWYDED